MKLLPVIVLYKRALHESVTYQTLFSGYTGEIFVYDNSPSAHPVENEKIVYIHNPENPGISKAYNTAAAYAGEHCFEWLLFLDQDTHFPTGALQKYLDIPEQHPDISIFAPTLVVNGNTPFSPAKYVRKRARKVRLQPDKSYPLATYSPVNSGILVNLKAFEAAGGYNEKVKLDLSDFVFIEALSEVTPEFYLMDLLVQQSYNEALPSLESELFRFKIYLECIKNAPRKNLSDRFWYWRTGLRRALSLTLRRRSFIFISEFFK